MPEFSAPEGPKVDLSYIERLRDELPRIHAARDTLNQELFQQHEGTNEIKAADGIVPEFERLKRHAQQSVDFVGEHCQSSLMVTSDGKPISVGETGQATPRI